MSPETGAELPSWRVASLEGFSYLLRAPQPLGSSVARWNQAEGFLRHGTVSGYDTFFDESFLAALSPDQRTRALAMEPRIRYLPFGTLLRRPADEYAVICGETIDPARQLGFRHLLGNPKIPLVRTLYTIATAGHLREVLDVCLLERGGRPYDALVVLSEATRAALRAYIGDLAQESDGFAGYRGRIEVIHPGIDHEALAARDTGAARRHFGIPQSAVVFLSNARIDPITKMDYTRVLECFARALLSTEGQELCLVIAGADSGGGARRILEMVAGTPLRGRTRVIADYPESQKADLLSTGDVFLALNGNLQESFGVSLIEAMAAGLPVVCGDWDGFRDIVIHERTGFLVPTLWQARHDPADGLQMLRQPFDHTLIHTLSQQVAIDLGKAARHLRDLAMNPGLRRSMGNASRERVREYFTLAHHTRRHEALWRELSAIAAGDAGCYPDAWPLLRYDYPRHFASYPSGVR